MIEKIQKRTWPVLSEQMIKEEYYEYAKRNNKLKFIKLTTKDPFVSEVCLGNFKPEDGYDVRTIDCENEMERAKQMSYFPPPPNSKVGQNGISNLSQASQIKLRCICEEKRYLLTLKYRQF